MVWGPQEEVVEHIYFKNLRNLCSKEWETIVWGFAATTAQKSCKVAAMPTILKTAIISQNTQKSWNTSILVSSPADIGLSGIKLSRVLKNCAEIAL